MKAKIRRQHQQGRVLKSTRKTTPLSHPKLITKGRILAVVVGGEGVVVGEEVEEVGTERMEMANERVGGIVSASLVVANAGLVAEDVAVKDVVKVVVKDAALTVKDAIPNPPKMAVAMPRAVRATQRVARANLVVAVPWQQRRRQEVKKSRHYRPCQLRTMRRRPHPKRLILLQRLWMILTPIR